MVGVVQSVEHLFVAQGVAGSSPVAHPINKKTRALVAQWIEHQTSRIEG